MGRSKASWQNSDEVLSYFCERVGAARLKYRRFLREGLSQGKWADLVGGGLIQSQEGGKEKEPEGEGFYDKRVLGETRSNFTCFRTNSWIKINEINIPLIHLIPSFYVQMTPFINSGQSFFIFRCFLKGEGKHFLFILSVYFIGLLS